MSFCVFLSGNPVNSSTWEQGKVKKLCFQDSSEWEASLINVQNIKQ